MITLCPRHVTVLRLATGYMGEGQILLRRIAEEVSVGPGEGACKVNKKNNSTVYT